MPLNPFRAYETAIKSTAALGLSLPAIELIKIERVLKNKFLLFLRMTNPTRSVQAVSGKHRARLTEAEVICIFQAKTTPVQASSVARAYQVSEKAIRDIWTGRTWAKETSHLNPSRILIVKKTGRPKGSRDLRPRQKRVLGQHRQTIKSGDHIMKTQLWKASPDNHEGVVHETKEDDHLAMPVLPSNTILLTVQETSATWRCAADTLDELLYQWEGEFCDQRMSDPFKDDWAAFRANNNLK